MMRSTVFALAVLCAGIPALAQRGGDRPGGANGNGGGNGSGGNGGRTSGGVVTAPAAPRSFPVPRVSGNGEPGGYGGIRVSSFGTQVLPGASAGQNSRGHEVRGRYGSGGVAVVPFGYGFAAPYEVSGVAGDEGISPPAQELNEPYAEAYAPPRYAPRAAAGSPQGYVAEQEEEVAAPRVAAQAAPVRGAAAALPEQDAVTVVFKDRRPSEQIRNYMLTRTTLYITDRKRREIPMDEIDIPATVKANRGTGVSFQLPAK